MIHTLSRIRRGGSLLEASCVACRSGVVALRVSLTEAARVRCRSAIGIAAWGSSAVAARAVASGAVRILRCAPTTIPLSTAAGAAIWISLNIKKIREKCRGCH